MKKLGVPLLFQPIYRDYLWGGTEIAKRFGRYQAPARCAESWELAGHATGDTVVSAGPWGGRSLNNLTAEFGRALLGTAAPEQPIFPLLFKLIDARQTLSVQVHPNEANAQLTSGEPKSEAWVVLGCTAQAKIYAGLKDVKDANTLRAVLDKGTMAAHLQAWKPRQGDVLYIPGGLVHAIGAGCLIYEVQQSSNTTYRLFDWQRVDAQGRARPLHIEESLRSIVWDLQAPVPKQPPRAMVAAQNTWFELVASPFFVIKKWLVCQPDVLSLDGTSFVVLFAFKGRVRLTAGAESITLAQGRSALIPAAAARCAVEPLEAAEVYVTTLNLTTFRCLP